MWLVGIRCRTQYGVGSKVHKHCLPNYVHRTRGPDFRQTQLCHFYTSFVPLPGLVYWVRGQSRVSPRWSTDRILVCTDCMLHIDMALPMISLRSSSGPVMSWSASRVTFSPIPGGELLSRNCFTLYSGVELVNANRGLWTYSPKL